MTLRNPLDSLATEATLDRIADRSNSAGDAMLVSGSNSRWRREFNDASLEAWDVVRAPSMTVTAGAVSTGALQVGIGTVANAETTITSKAKFRAPFRSQFGVQLSSKIANVEVYLEIVAVNEDGSLDETAVAAWRIAGSDSTTTTNARTEVRNGGDSRLQSANVASQATQTAASIYELVLEADEVRFYSKVADTSATRAAGQVRNTVAPDPNRDYKMRYRFRTGTVAPASSVTFTSAFATAVDYTEQQVEVSGGNGSINGDQAIPTYSTGGTVVASVSSTTLSGSPTVAGTLVAKVLSTATTNPVLAKTGSSRLYGYQIANTGAAWRYVKFYNKATAPVPGTDVPVMVVPLAPGGVIGMQSAVPVSFALGLGYAITAGPADSDTAAVAANEIVGHLLYA